MRANKVRFSAAIITFLLLVSAVHAQQIQRPGGSVISGLTTGTIPKAASASTLTDSIISELSGVVTVTGDAVATGLLQAGTTFGISTDVLLNRDAANILALRNGVNSQSFRLYKTWTDAANYRRLTFDFSSDSPQISAEKAGTGAGDDFIIKNTTAHALIFGTANVLRWQIRSDGHFISQADNTYDIGATGATRPRTGYFGTSVISPVVTATGLITGGSFKSDAPVGGTSGTWKIGVAAAVSPTAPNRTVELDIGGTIYYLAAKTTND